MKSKDEFAGAKVKFDENSAVSGLDFKGIEDNGNVYSSNKGKKLSKAEAKKFIEKEEKETLKQEIEAVNVQLSEGKITQEQADKRKKELAEARAVIIEEKVTRMKRWKSVSLY